MDARRGIAAALSALALAACGGDGGAGEQGTGTPRSQPGTTAPEPALPADLAEDLAQASDEVAASLDEGDSCGAKDEAERLREETEEAIESGEVPSALREPLLSAVERLEGQISCLPAEPSGDENGDGDEGKGKGKGEGKGKGKGHGGNGEEEDD
jgi:hypothetical protein